MKNFLNSESLIYKNYTNSIYERFYRLRYGIKKCSRDICENLSEIRYDLLQWQISTDKDKEQEPLPLISWGFYSSDPFFTLSQDGTDSLQFQKIYFDTSQILEFTNNAANKYLVVKEPVSATPKGQWKNTDFNYGQIPDQVFRAPFIVEDFRYYVSRIPVALGLNSTQIIFYILTPPE